MDYKDEKKKKEKKHDCYEDEINKFKVYLKSKSK